ncbi:MAG: carbamoyltransferase HypF [Kiritimatiellae bacterium]|nr:carbamoyltransferase HypF [Kiritimatiellia bacterium]
METRARLRITAQGAVQGVGFRPFVHRLAMNLALDGWVLNAPDGVTIEVEGPRDRLDMFLLRLEREKPPHAALYSLESAFLDPVGISGFTIRESLPAGPKTTTVLPDIATCPDCLRELFDATDRRYLYPFINCTNCGPRFSIIERLPYDRPNTTMKRFQMCDACRAEYENPADRRFHAQPIACPKCGPQLALWNADGKTTADRHAALLAAAAALSEGRIVALKGLGGFQILVDARNAGAVRRLRAHKQREEKPFALMYPSLDAARADCEVSPIEERLLLSSEAPIVLLCRRGRPEFLQPAADCPVAPRNPRLGIMLPYTPLHHLLMRELGFPVIATSGNLSEEPICIDEHDALERLAGMADFFLVHDRPVARHVDDSIVRVTAGREAVLRRARGYAPLPVRVKDDLEPVVAVGGHLKNTVAVAAGRQIFVSQHIGDLETPRALDAFKHALSDLQGLYDVRPRHVACDMHPDYLSTKHAHSMGMPVVAVQHHHAHIAACMAENELDGHVLGVAWDGTGYGTDGTVWGGEFLRATLADFERVAHFKTFRLPGGEMAIREPRRAALGLLYEALSEDLFTMEDLAPMRAFTESERKTLRRVLAKSVHAPVTSSAGRLFDVVASLLDLCQVSRFEGQAAMELEFALAGAETDDAYGFDIEGTGIPANPWVVDWTGMIGAVLKDLEDRTPPGLVSAKFHNSLVEVIADIAELAREERVVLSGGCFQNRYLTERAVRRLAEEGFRPYWHQRIPPNDGGICLGQAVVAGVRNLKFEI